MPSHVDIGEDSPRRDAALRFLFDRIDYERALAVPYRDREFKLDRVRELLRRLGDPQSELPIVHVAGTKGKGSVAAMAGAVLQAAGYRTGIFTSPHLDRLEQRMAVDGQPCGADELAELVDRVKPEVEAMDRAIAVDDADETGPTYFELTTALALLHFARRKVDVAVLEVGLGGRLDSTNVCQPCVSVITSISFDHTRQLGNTLASIAREKAGIIKPGVPVISGVTQHEPREVIRQTCRGKGCRLVELGKDFDFDYEPPRHLEQAPATGRLDFGYHVDGRAWQIDGLALRLTGRHQAANAAVALAMLAELQRAGWKIPETAIRAGMAEVELPARVEVVARQPTVVIDAAHNLASVEALTEVLDESFSVAARLLIFATTQEKDLRGMLNCLLERFDRVVFTRYVNNPRAVPPEELAALAAEITGREHTVCADPADACRVVRDWACPRDLICIAGSFYIAAEMRRLLAASPSLLHAEAETRVTNESA